MLTFASPTQLKDDQLVQEIEAKGFSGASITHRPDDGEIEVSGIDDANRDTVQTIVDAHVPAPPPPDPNEELRKALEAATTLQELKDALTGKSRPTRVEGRPT